MGACALQVGHQVAWISTSIDLPAFCAASNAAGVYAIVSAAKAAGVTTRVTPRIPAAIRFRREIMTIFLVRASSGAVGPQLVYALWSAFVTPVVPPNRSLPRIGSRSRDRPRALLRSLWRGRLARLANVGLPIPITAF